MTSQLKFDGPHLEDVLARVRKEVGEHAVIVEAHRSLKGGVAGFFAKEWFEVVVEAPTRPESTIRSDNQEALLAWADRIEDSGEVTPVFAQVLAKTVTPTLMVAPVDELMPPLVTTEKLLTQLPLDEMLVALDKVVPGPFRPAPGPSIIAVVGDVTASVKVAGDLAKRLGQNPGDVVVASQNAQANLPAWMQINSKAMARQRAARWRMGDQPIVVAVDLRPGLDGHTWAGEVIGALGVDHVRLVAKAWQVTSDIAPKAAVLGGVDGIELVELADCATPEIFLEVGFPVLGIDGRVATAELWAALLMERRSDEG